MSSEGRGPRYVAARVAFELLVVGGGLATVGVAVVWLQTAVAAAGHSFLGLLVNGAIFFVALPALGRLSTLEEPNLRGIIFIGAGRSEPGSVLAGATRAPFCGAYPRSVCGGTAQAALSHDEHARARGREHRQACATALDRRAVKRNGRPPESRARARPRALLDAMAKREMMIAAYGQLLDHGC
jgi:hypothetical protein